MKRALFAMVLGVPAVVLSLAACKKEDTAATSGSSSASAAANSASGATSLTSLTSASPTDSTTDTTPTADPDKLPPPAAQATAAAKTVTTANYKSELDTIEKELNGIK